MLVGDLLLLLMAILLLVVLSSVIGLIAFGVARWGGAKVPTAITSASVATATTMLIGIGLLAAVIPLAT
ncbi:hypothetical protein [Streptomyces rishiriensis]|uniref:Uncharacterized membrane protein (DUF485 family) n=1 Tax=Streptomyces rishiriensis TaxID=68264 RepID=A0ABU0NFK3_STRRH|nr:hypothetical protein [Streptomyces rishiriensis]MDQ0577878.1 uncharacterized membrane protein (DUF485 family) [Streptomyces rishiriensis]